MKKGIIVIALGIVFSMVFTIAYAAGGTGSGESGLITYDKSKAFDGYTLFAPVSSTNTYLIDMEGRVVNQWNSDYTPGQSVYLLDYGNILRTGSVEADNKTFRGGGMGGYVQEFDWDGKVVWNFKYSEEKKYLQHHDIEVLPNGNILMVVWELKTKEESVEVGRDIKGQGEIDLWTDHIIEVRPIGRTKGEIVWEWHIWDHLVQDFDKSKGNYGNVADHPELISINLLDWTKQLSEEEFKQLKSVGYIGSSTTTSANPDWTHVNAIDYNPELDQIMISVLGFNEFWIIDHSTTTEEAAGHKGGKSGKGGDLLYRWGNPLAYFSGENKDMRLIGQHDAHWIPAGMPGAGNVLVFNNGGRGIRDYSTVDEIVPPLNAKGLYDKPGQAYGPTEALWSCTLDDPDFTSLHLSGAQRLPNGNTLICSGDTGAFFEVTPDKKVAWKYVYPAVPKRQGRREIAQNTVFRAYRYAKDYPGLADVDLTPGAKISAK